MLQTFLSRKWLYRTTLLVFGILMLLWLLNYPIYGLLQSITYNDLSTFDGPFQLNNALRRIAAGMDYQFFHGKATALIHYPIYVLFGQTLNAMQFSRYFVLIFVFIVTLTAVTLTAFKHPRARLMFAVSVIAFSATAWGMGTMLPINTSLGVRTFMPLIVFALMLAPVHRGKGVLVGVSIAISILFSTEHGIALIAGFFGIGGLILVIKRACWRENLAFLLQALIGFVVSAPLFLIVISGGVEQAVTALRFNFQEVIADQVWYFGVSPNSFVDGWTDFIRIDFLFTVIPSVAVLIYTARRLLREQQPLFHTSLSFASLVLITYALLSISSWVFSYQNLTLLSPLIRANFLLIALFLLKPFDQPTAALLPKPHERAAMNLIGGMLVMCLITPPTVLYRLTLKGVIDGIAYAAENGTPPLSEYWMEYAETAISAVDAASTDTPVSLWGVYSSFLSQHYGVFNPGDTDYIIHALGEERRAAYVTQFVEMKPQFVEMPRIDRFPYGEWMMNESWEFFETLYANYHVLVETEHSVILERNSGEWQTLPTDCAVYPITGRTLILPPELLADHPLPYAMTATVTYEVRNPLEAVPVVNTLPRYLVTVWGGFHVPVSLPPRGTSFTFPVILLRDDLNDPPQLLFSVASLPRSVSIQGISVCLRPSVIPQENMRLLLALPNE